MIVGPAILLVVNVNRLPFIFGQKWLAIRVACGSAGGKHEPVWAARGAVARNPLEKKLSMFVAPVFVTVVGAILIAAFTGGGGGGNGSSGRTEQAENLELVDLAVADGEPIKPAYEKFNPPFVDITVRNTGSVVSVVKRVAFRVRNFGFVSSCFEGAPLFPSTQYDASLPPNPRLGQPVDTIKKVSQVVPPNQVDRFTIKLNVPFQPRADGHVPLINSTCCSTTTPIRNRSKPGRSYCSLSLTLSPRRDFLGPLFGPRGPETERPTNGWSRSKASARRVGLL